MVFLLPALPALIEFGAAAIQVALAIIACLAAYEAAQMIANDETTIVPASSLPQQGEVVTAPDAAAQAAQAAVEAAIAVLGTAGALELIRRYNKTPRKPGIGVQYCLTAADDGNYIHFNLGRTIPLKLGETWKYGETMQWTSPSGPQWRYSTEDLKTNLARGKPVIFNAEYQGTQNEIKAEEYKKIITYKRLHGRRPPGNKIDR
jgi:hypothetical protein